MHGNDGPLCSSVSLFVVLQTNGSKTGRSRYKGRNLCRETVSQYFLVLQSSLRDTTAKSALLLFEIITNDVCRSNDRGFNARYQIFVFQIPVNFV